MGANAVTTVPVYTAGEVLTAADLNITNSGIPVFADSTARTAAFGGSGEKVLAEGQFAYLESDNTTYYYDGAAWQAVATTSAVSAVNVNRVNTTEATSSSSYVGLTTAQTITMTTGTKVLVLLSYNFAADDAVEAYASVAVSGATTTAAADANSAFAQSSKSGGYRFSVSNAIPLTVTAGSNTFTMQFRGSGNISCNNRTMTVIAYS
jgi:hypothetical protein